MCLKPNCAVQYDGRIVELIDFAARRRSRQPLETIGPGRDPWMLPWFFKLFALRGVQTSDCTSGRDRVFYTVPKCSVALLCVSKADAGEARHPFAKGAGENRVDFA